MGALADDDHAHDDIGGRRPLLRRITDGLTSVIVAGLLVAAAVAVAVLVQPRFADAAPHRIADASSSGDVYLRGCGGSAVQQPMTIIGWCASGDALYSNLQWTAWNGHAAEAVGTYFRNSCDCAGGTIERYPVRITLTRPEATGEAVRWTRAAVGYPAARPEDASRTQQYRLTADGLVPEDDDGR